MPQIQRRGKETESATSPALREELQGAIANGPSLGKVGYEEHGQASSQPEPLRYRSSFKRTLALYGKLHKEWVA